MDLNGTIWLSMMEQALFVATEIDLIQTWNQIFFLLFPGMNIKLYGFYWHDLYKDKGQSLSTRNYILSFDLASCTKQRPLDKKNDAKT